MRSKIQSFFFSLQTAYFFFILLAAIFGAGSYLAGFEETGRLFDQITSECIWKYIDDIVANHLLLTWFLLLVVCAAVVFINTLCCTSQLLKQCFINKIGKTKQFRLRFMTFIHIIALAVIVCHALEIMLVTRHSPVKILVSGMATLAPYQVKVKNISYITDRSFIQEDVDGKRLPGFKIPLEKFSIEGNKAELAVYRDGVLVKEGEIRLFEPLRVGNSFFIMDGFFIPHHKSDTIGILIHHTYNPLVVPFFVIYAVLFTTLLVQYIRNRCQVSVQNNSFYRE